MIVRTVTLANGMVLLPDHSDPGVLSPYEYGAFVAFEKWANCLCHGADVPVRNEVFVRGWPGDEAADFVLGYADNIDNAELIAVAATGHGLKHARQRAMER